MENIGEPYSFELLPYWAGEHPVERTPGWPDQEPYALPFHPLDMREDALRAFFGFIIEGMPDPEDIDAEAVELLDFQVSGPDVEAWPLRRKPYKPRSPQWGRPEDSARRKTATSSRSPRPGSARRPQQIPVDHLATGQRSLRVGSNA
jgi:hypothetical protein